MKVGYYGIKESHLNWPLIKQMYIQYLQNDENNKPTGNTGC